MTRHVSGYNRLRDCLAALGATGDAERPLALVNSLLDTLEDTTDAVGQPALLTDTRGPGDFFSSATVAAI